MLHVIKIVSITLLLALTSVGCGPEPAVMRSELHGADVPNGPAFYMSLISLDHSNTRFGLAFAAHGIEDALGLSYVDSEAFVSQALTTLDAINADEKAENVRIACEATAPGVSKKAKYDALQQMYDARRAVTNHYFEQTKASLDAEAGERLQEWVDELKLGMGTADIDFEKTDQLHWFRDSTAQLSRMCGAAN